MYDANTMTARDVERLAEYFEGYVWCNGLETNEQTIETLVDEFDALNNQ